MVFPYVWIFRISEWLLSRLRCASFSFLGGGQDQILIFTLETCCVHRILADWTFSIWPILDLEKGAVQCSGAASSKKLIAVTAFNKPDFFCLANE